MMCVGRQTLWRFSEVTERLCPQTGYDVQQAEEDSSGPAVPADSSLRQDEGLPPNGAGAEFWR